MNDRDGSLLPLEEGSRSQARSAGGEMEPIDEEQGLIGRRSGDAGGGGGGESGLSRRTWPTVDGPHGLSEEESLAYARSYFYWGFAFLPFLWAVNCCYFWPILRKSHPSPQIRPYVVRSAIGFLIFSVVLASWSVTFMVGGEQLFGSMWNDLVMYNLADSGLNCSLMGFLILFGRVFLSWGAHGIDKHIFCAKQL